jgi:hypothetical protein
MDKKAANKLPFLFLGNSGVTNVKLMLHIWHGSGVWTFNVVKIGAYFTYVFLYFECFENFLIFFSPLRDSLYEA